MRDHAAAGAEQGGDALHVLGDMALVLLQQTRRIERDAREIRCLDLPARDRRQAAGHHEHRALRGARSAAEPDRRRDRAGLVPVRAQRLRHAARARSDDPALLRFAPDDAPDRRKVGSARHVEQQRGAVARSLLDGVIELAAIS